LLVEGDGAPLGAVIAAANVNDHTRLGATLESVVVERPDPERVEPHLCRDAGHDNGPAREVVAAHGSVGHIRPAQAATLGGGADAGVAVEVPGVAGPLRQAR
jgi:hypothetical protein